MTPIPFFDLKRQYKNIKKEILPAIQEVFAKTAFSGGPFVEKFEKQFAKFIGTTHAAGLNSGTSALHLALEALGVTEGDEVIVPTNTFIATAWAVSYVRATPVFVDCTIDTWQIDPKAVEKAISPKTKAIIVVHLYGAPANMPALLTLAKKHNLYLIEDCAQSHGATVGNNKTGALGDIGCFSFYPSKNLGAYGEGGAITTNQTHLAEKIIMLRNHGGKEKYFHETLGYNMRMDGVQAAVLSIKLKHLKAWSTRRQAIAKKYRAEIKNPVIRTQTITPGTQSVYYLFVFTVPDRKHFTAYLEKHGIGYGLHYPTPCHLQKAYAHLNYRKGDFPNAEYLSEHCVSLPLFPELRKSEISRIVRVINSYKEL